MRLALAVFVLAAAALAACDSNTVTTCPSSDVLVTVADSLVGTGQPASSDFVADYVGRLVVAPDTFFDRGFNVRFTDVIPGFRQGVTGRAATDDAPAISPMRPGGIRRIFIPTRFGYGAYPPTPAIPACSDLIFDVTLVDP